MTVFYYAFEEGSMWPLKDSEVIADVVNLGPKGVIILNANGCFYRIKRPTEHNNYELYDYHTDQTKKMTPQQMRVYVSTLVKLNERGI